jgi:hypothetical protein
LIHELGHIEDFRHTKVSSLLRYLQRTDKTSLMYKREVRGWKLGIRLAKELGIQYDKKLLAGLAKNALVSYASLAGIQKKENEDARI